jgi:type II secretory ATPase GspE/PulE/Tfp pilus assembly ATPase PilB-like protein
MRELDVDMHAPTVQLVDALIRKAIQRHVSDIHLESTTHALRIRYRIDGMLHDQDPIPPALAPQIIARIKVLAHLDITQQRIPQDGKFHLLHNGHPIDIRISTFPSLHGQKVVIRILDRVKTALELEHLGFAHHTLSGITRLLGKSHGFFLVAGPTGSGKTTTLYAALQVLNHPSKHVITLEDPVEYHIAGITQGQIQPETGFTFERGMRAILRQDPDIIMIGEIRDKQTAQIAIEAALTGHVVLSTIHTNDAPSVIMRLMDMGIEPFLINAAIHGVLAQRLIRMVCTTCRAYHAPTDQEKQLLNKLGADTIDQLAHGSGCATCLHTGYKGRMGIFEFMPITATLRSYIVQHPSYDVLHHQAQADGMKPLIYDGLMKVRDGITTLAELVRVVY